MTASTVPATLNQSVAHCRDVTRAHSKTFYLGSRFFPPRQRDAVWAVYAACRDGDDIADETSGERAHEALAEWWQRTQRAFQGQPSGRPGDLALTWAAQTYAIPLSAFHELHEGLLMDVRGHTFETMDDLTLYCRRVAGVVGFMIAPISGYHGGERTLEYALHLGQAMQLTNILRDVGEDLARGRVYLPRSVMARHGVTDATLEAGVVTPAYRALMRDLSALARQWYAQGRRGIPLLHGSGRLAVATAARAYEGILDDLARNDFDNFGRRAHVSGPRKLMMLPRVWWELRTAPTP
ncbi:phytoene synthase [Deinococcus metalli]|nr:phytoene/squalene synthase family protein [Deinococcus metalli]MBB5374948.1 phytoene synthase [Deinococcus metalli]